MEIKRQSIAFNIVNNFRDPDVFTNSVDRIVETLNDNFNKGLIDELTVSEAIEQFDNVLKKSMSHKYFKREGTPGNYKYYYTEADWKAGRNSESEETDKKLPKIKDVHLASLKEGGMTIDAVVDGQKVGPVKLSKEDLNNFTDKTDRLELAKKYFLYDHDKELKESQKDIFDEFKNMSEAEVYKIAKTPNDPLSEHAKIEYNRRAKEKGAIEPAFTKPNIDENKLQQEKDHHEAVKKYLSSGGEGKISEKKSSNLKIEFVQEGTLDPTKPDYKEKLSKVDWNRVDIANYRQRIEYLGKLDNGKYGIKYYSPNGKNSDIIEVVEEDYKRDLERNRYAVKN